MAALKRGRSGGLFGSLSQRQLNTASKTSLSKSYGASIEDNFQKMVIYESARLSDRRVEIFRWHPTDRDVVAVADKGGSVVLWKPDVPGDTQDIVVSGCKCRVTELMFDPFNSNRVYMSGANRCLQVHDLTNGRREVILDTMDWKLWFVSMAISTELGYVVVGGNNGFISFCDLNTGKRVVHRKVHRGKLNHIAFHPRDNNIMVTAGHDKMMRIYDVRKFVSVTAEDNPICEIPIDGNPNSAYFSPLTGDKILVTLQNQGCRVYNSLSPTDDPLVVEAPTQFFQHMTPIKAVWHPLSDHLFVCGKYRSNSGVTSIGKGIDLWNGETGEHVAELLPPQAAAKTGPRVCPVNSFSPDGHILVSGSGHSVYAWRVREEADRIKNTASEKLKAERKRALEFGLADDDADFNTDGDDNDDDDDDGSDDSPGGRPAKRARKGPGPAKFPSQKSGKQSSKGSSKKRSSGSTKGKGSKGKGKGSKKGGKKGGKGDKSPYF